MIYSNGLKKLQKRERARSIQTSNMANSASVESTITSDSRVIRRILKLRKTCGESSSTTWVSTDVPCIRRL